MDFEKEVLELKPDIFFVNSDGFTPAKETFCREHGIDQRRSNFAGLALEEMAGNVVEHGFTKDKKNHVVDMRVVHKRAASVRAGLLDDLKRAEALLKELLTLENPYACPHGRPTMIRFSRTELEKKFKRIV